MHQEELESAVERLMAQVDYYLHCELDAEYQRDSPSEARERLEQALRAELSRPVMRLPGKTKGFPVI